MGLRSLVLESSESLRVAGFSFTTWNNAWKALDALGIGDSLRQQSDLVQGLVATSMISGTPSSQISFTNKLQAKKGDELEELEVRCVGRRLLLEALEKELPRGTIRLSSKVVSIQEEQAAGYCKLVHLADGSIIKTKVLIGCDGVNSVVAKWLGLQEAAFTGRVAIRGHAVFDQGHHFEPKLMQFFGDGFRTTFIPCDRNIIYWVFTCTPSTLPKEEKFEAGEPAKMKQFVLKNLCKIPKEVVGVVEKTDTKNIICSPLRLRWPLSVLLGNINKGNVCVAGDALHPMTPDLGQGGCSALEDGVVLARCLGQALLSLRKTGRPSNDDKEEYNRIKKGLDKFAKERRWRSFDLITTSYIVGLIQQSSGKVMNYIRDNFLSTYLARTLLKRTDFDCGKLMIS
ncbi:Monooxygenase [Macleaya cordata]|uniref:Monooxygenase n=1 Tax=Macleaya cordata TaxID=56857 RepID=A0A200RC88_MACCD|nr:Monooxygenase [Macleaya cordata]